MKNALSILLLLVMVIAGCQPAEAPPESQSYFADFFVRYLAAERQLKAYASFFEGDSLATAAARPLPEGVTFQGNPMERRDLPNELIRYTDLRTAGFNGRYTFAFTDQQGTPREQVIEMTPVERFSLPDGISRTRGLTLEISGGPLLTNQSLVLLFSDASKRAFSITIDGPTTTEVLQVSPDKLSSLPSGTAQLYLVKKQSIISRARQTTTIAEIEYYTGIQEVEVKE